MKWKINVHAYFPCSVPLAHINTLNEEFWDPHIYGSMFRHGHTWKKRNSYLRCFVVVYLFRRQRPSVIDLFVFHYGSSLRSYGLTATFLFCSCIFISIVLFFIPSSFVSLYPYQEYIKIFPSCKSRLLQHTAPCLTLKSHIFSTVCSYLVSMILTIHSAYLQVERKSFVFLMNAVLTANKK
jgi:hypothetical protein